MHLLPSKFDLQEHTPLELHDEEEAPELLQPQAKKLKIHWFLQLLAFGKIKFSSFFNLFEAYKQRYRHDH